MKINLSMKYYIIEFLHIRLSRTFSIRSFLSIRDRLNYDQRMSMNQSYISHISLKIIHKNRPKFRM